MKRFLIILAIGCGLFAIAQKPAKAPAYKGVIERVQPNGDTVRVRLHGDERMHWMTLEEGKQKRLHLLCQKEERWQNCSNRKESEK